MSIREKLKEQITAGLEEAEFPIYGPQQFLDSFPRGAETTCQVGDVKLTAGEAGLLLNEDDFPFSNAEEVAEIILDRVDL